MEKRVHELEDDRRRFERALNNATKGLIVLGLILAFAQVMTMTHESMLYKFGQWVYQAVAVTK